MSKTLPAIRSSITMKIVIIILTDQSYNMVISMEEKRNRKKTKIAIKSYGFSTRSYIK